VLDKVQQIALKCHRLLGCRGATRTDMIIVKTEQDTYAPFVLEVNTLPGMTSTSLLPNSAKSVGIDFDALVHWVALDALRMHAEEA